MVRLIRKTDGSCRTCRIGDALDDASDYEGLYADVAAYSNHGRVRCPSGVCVSTKRLFESSANGEGIVYFSELKLILTPSVPGGGCVRPVSAEDDGAAFDLRLQFTSCNCEYEADDGSATIGDAEFEVSSEISVAIPFAQAMKILFSVNDQHAVSLTDHDGATT